MRSRRGFTLIEIAVVVMIVGILAGIAIPALQYALLRADAARLVADANTVRNAAYAHLSENGVFPTSGAAGVVPAQLAPHLPDNFPFVYKGVTYRWFSINSPWITSIFGTRTFAILILDYSARPELAGPMQGHAGANAIWGPGVFYFMFYG